MSISLLVAKVQVCTAQPCFSSMQNRHQAIVLTSSHCVCVPFYTGFQSRRDREQGSSSQGVGGLKELGVRHLTYTLVFVANHVESTNSISGTERSDVPSYFTNDEAANKQLAEAEFSLEERKRIADMKRQPKLYSRIVKSLAPNICGHDDIKRGILLMMLGGVHKSSAVDKTQLRGDINICLVGDPSTSKSQFLKYVHSFVPRAVYTSGKASSAAGLTASIVKGTLICLSSGSILHVAHVLTLMCLLLSQTLRLVSSLLRLVHSFLRTLVYAA